MTDQTETYDYLKGWDPIKEHEKALFLEHMYQCSGRQDPKHPMHSLFTGLWQEFCVKEAGPVMRDRYFEMMSAIQMYEEMQRNQTSVEGAGCTLKTNGDN